jgi:hypothetical protein
MATSSVRQFDNAAGIVVLLLLAIAVAGGQSATRSNVDGGPGINGLATHRLSGPDDSSVGQQSDSSVRIISAELAFPATDLIREFRLRDSDDDHPALLDD